MNLMTKMIVVMVNPALMDFSVVSNGNSNHIFVPSATVESTLLQPEQFYFICSQLIDPQKYFFSFIMTYIMTCETAFRNNVEEPEPSYSGGAGVGKSFCKCYISKCQKKSQVSWSKFRTTFLCNNCIYRLRSLSYKWLNNIFSFSFKNKRKQ